MEELRKTFLFIYLVNILEVKKGQGHIILQVRFHRARTQGGPVVSLKAAGPEGTSMSASPEMNPK